MRDRPPVAPAGCPSAASLAMGTGRGERGGRQVLQLVQGDVAEVLGESPPMAERVEHLTLALAPEGVAEWPDDGRAGADGPGPRAVDVVHLQVDRAVGLADVLGAVGVELGELVGQRDPQVSDPELDVDEPVARDTIRVSSSRRTPRRTSGRRRPRRGR